MTSLRLGTYELIERLHQGGLAEVFLARQIGRTPPVPITLKRIDAEVIADPKRGAHIPDRAREALILEHPGILGMLEVGEAAGSTYIATEYLAGRPLRALLKALAKKKERLELPLAILIGTRICEALVHAHAAGSDTADSQGVVHAAISPDSIRIGLGGEVKLEDFGSMPATWKQRSVSKNERLGFLSPEQLAGGPLTPATDLYALGLVLYELVMGRRLYGPAPRALRLQELLDGAELPLEAELPEALLDVLRQALARKPEERFQSAEALLEALRRIEDASPEATGSDDQLAALMARIFPDAHSTEALRQTRLLKGPPLSMSSPSSPHPEDPASTPDAAVEEPSAKVVEETSEHASAGDAGGDDAASSSADDGREAAVSAEDASTSSRAGDDAAGEATDAEAPDATSEQGASTKAAETGSKEGSTSAAPPTGKDSEQADAPASDAAVASSTKPTSPEQSQGEGADAEAAGPSASTAAKGDGEAATSGPTGENASEPSHSPVAATGSVVPAIAPVAAATSALSDASKPATTAAGSASASQSPPAGSKPAPSAAASSGSEPAAAAAPGASSAEKPAPSAAASSSAPKPAPSASAPSSSPKPAPSASASSSAPKPAPTAAASSSAPKPTPTASASSSAPKPAPTAAEPSSAPKPAPSATATSSAPKSAPSASASSSGPKPAPSVSASSSAPKPSPTASASSSAPKPAPSAAASSSAPKPAPSAAASSSESEPVTAETALPGTPISATSEVSLPDYRDFDDDDDDEDERTHLITTELLVSSLPAAEVPAVSAAPSAPAPSAPPRKTAVVTRPSSTPRATGTRPAAGTAPSSVDSSRPASPRTGVRPAVSDPGSGPRRTPTRPPSGEVRAVQGNRRTASRTSIPAVGRSQTPVQETRGAGSQGAPPRDTGTGRRTGSGRSQTPASRPARRATHTELPAAGAGKGTPIPRTFSASHPAFDAIKEAESFPASRPGAAQPKMEILAASPASAPAPEPAQRPLVPVPSSRPATTSPVRSAATLSGSLLDSVPKSLWVVAGLVLLLLMLGLGFSLRGAPVSEVVVHVTPAEGALITLDGRQLQSGQPIALPPGEYELVAIAEGYQRYSQRITVFKDAEQAIYPITLQSDALRRVPTATGVGAENAGTFTVRFTTTTPGVEIWVEGRSVGKTPEATAVLAIGRPHHYEARAQGYEATMGTVGSFGDPEVSVQLTLQPAVDRVRNPNAPPAGGTGRLVVDTEPTGAEIYVNGVPTGRRTPVTSVDPLTLPAGKHRLRFAHGDRVSRLQNVTLERGQTIMLDDVAIDQAR